jgi:N-acetylmuramoyl-L-alanine amidase
MAVQLRCAPRRAFSLGWFGALLCALTLFLPNDSSAAPQLVVIDPGHGGFDRGGIPGQRVPEKAMALDVAQRVAKRLQAAGDRVIMTRNSDVFVPLGGRVAVGNSHPDAIFLCIHFNSASRSGANGIETYYYRSDSARLASNIHKQVVAGTLTENRGIRRRGFYVLRRTTIPSVLVECGFLTNPSEARLVLQGSYRERLAERITNGVLGQPATSYRPLIAGLKTVTPPIPQPVGQNDFVRQESERRTITHHTRHKSSSHKSSHKSKKKKKSDD